MKHTPSDMSDLKTIPLSIADELPSVTLPNLTPEHAMAVKLGFLLHDVSRLRRSSFDRYMKPLGITRSQWWVVAHLSRHDGMMQTELATLLDLGKVTLGGIVDRLEAAGFIQRRPDANDRRAKRIYLTKKAEELIRDMHRVETDHNARVLDGISAKDRKKLIDLLVAMKANLKKTMD